MEGRRVITAGTDQYLTHKHYYYPPTWQITAEIAAIRSCRGSVYSYGMMFPQYSTVICVEYSRGRPLYSGLFHAWRLEY